MNQNSNPQPSTRHNPQRRFSQSWSRLVEPSARITEPGTRREVQLLSALLLALAALLIFGTVASLPVRGFDATVLGECVLVSFVIAAYALSRTQRYQWATIILVTVFSIQAFVSIYNNPARAGITVFAYLPIAFLVAGLLLPLRTAAFFVFVDTVIVFLLPLVVEGYPMREASVNGGIMLTLGVMIIIFNYVRNLTERDRLGALTKTNQELQTLRGQLEERVEERTAQLRASADVGRAAASILDTDQLLRQTVNLITERFGYYYAAIFTIDPTNTWAVLKEGTGEAGRVLKDSKHRLRLDGNSMVSTAIKTRDPQIAAQVGEGVTRFANPLLPDTQSEIALPLIVGKRVLGALDVQAARANAFDESSAAVLQSMANQIAVALSNSTQFQQTQLALQRAQQLYEASLAISEAGDIASAFQALIEAGIMDADRVLLLLFDAQGAPGRRTHAEVGGSWTRHPEDRPIPLGLELSAEQVPFINGVTSARPLVIQDVADPQVDQGYRRAMGNLNIKALMGLALDASNVNIGVLVLVYQEPHPLTGTNIQSFQALATLLAGVLYNQRLVAETRAALQQLDEANQRLTGQAWREYSRASGVVRKIDTAPGYTTARVSGSLPAQIEAPVTLRNTVIGTLRVEDAQPGRKWTPDEQALLEAVAHDLSLAIENQRLIEETEKRAQRERLVAGISSRMFAQNDLESIIEIAATELGRVLHLNRAEVRIEAEALVAAIPQVAGPSGNGQGEEARA